MCDEIKVGGHKGCNKFERKSESYLKKKLAHVIFITPHVYFLYRNVEFCCHVK